MTDCRSEDLTYCVPRFLSVVNLAYLYEAAKTADKVFDDQVKKAMTEGGDDSIGNINAARQSLLRAVFISAYGVLEQNIDEIIDVKRAAADISLLPSDLSHKGIIRSVVYAEKVLGKKVDRSTEVWQDLKFLQKVRNHLVHYGEGFSNSNDHTKIHSQCMKSKYLTCRPEICFSIDQIGAIFNLYVAFVEHFSHCCSASAVSPN
ncbi:hypothetical protein [Chitinilyticum aquatile]|uniref:hypothetical protein n=1 Tax=Chitinilyticum aquatile TaxID=362520 RepID=UPI0012DCBE81|nr:hypothetical protein [Chitinilyticum aquatile]